MIGDLDTAVSELLRALAPPGSELGEAEISFEAPDPDWRATLETLTLNCYLYRVHENQTLRQSQPVVERLDPAPEDGNGALPRGRQRPPPVPIDCSYCLTAWSTATDGAAMEEHQLLSEVLSVLLRHRVQRPEQFWDAVGEPVAPHPVVRTFAEDLSTPGEFWTALDHPVKPSLNCVFTVAFEPWLPEAAEAAELVDEVSVDVAHDTPQPPGSTHSANG